MSKGQSFIIEFILFFGISFSLFATISYYFYNQNSYLNEQIGESTTDLINKQISTDIVMANSCKNCDTILIRDKIPSQIGGYYYKIKAEDGLNTTLYSRKLFSNQGTIFNLNETFSLIGESKSENKRIEIKINNIDNIIEVK